MTSRTTVTVDLSGARALTAADRFVEYLVDLAEIESGFPPGYRPVGESPVSGLTELQQFIREAAAGETMTVTIAIDAEDDR